jgi:hypothetical protein
MCTCPVERDIGPLTTFGKLLIGENPKKQKKTPGNSLHIDFYDP